MTITQRWRTRHGEALKRGWGRGHTDETKRWEIRRNSRFDEAPSFPSLLGLQRSAALSQPSSIHRAQAIEILRKAEELRAGDKRCSLAPLMVPVRERSDLALPQTRT